MQNVQKEKKELSMPVVVGAVVLAVATFSGVGWFLTNRTSPPPRPPMQRMNMQQSSFQPPPGLAMPVTRGNGGGMPGMPPGMMGKMSPAMMSRMPPGMRSRMQGGLPPGVRPGPGGAARRGSMGPGAPGGGNPRMGFDPAMIRPGLDGSPPPGMTAGAPPPLPEGVPKDTVVKRVDPASVLPHKK